MASDDEIVAGTGTAGEDTSLDAGVADVAAVLETDPVVEFTNGSDSAAMGSADPTDAPALVEVSDAALENGLDVGAVAEGIEEGQGGLLGFQPAPDPDPSKGLLGFAPAVAPDAALVPDMGAEPVKTYREFYFVKIPRPDLTAEIAQIRAVELRVKEKRDKQQAVTAAFRAKKAAWSEAFEALKAARARARACSQDVSSKFDEAKPLQEMLRKMNEGNVTGRGGKGRGVPECTSEAQLNAVIAQVEHRMQHESISLKEEKQLLKELKDLEASRPKVKEIEARIASFMDSQGQRDSIQERLKPMMAEVDVLKLEREAANKICKTLQAEAEALDEEVKELLAERDRAVYEADKVFDELRALRAALNKKDEDFRQYRNDVAVIQDLAARKDASALEAFCEQQRERIHARLNSDDAYRSQYVALNQISTIRRFRSLDTRRLGVDEDPANLLDVPSRTPAATAPAAPAAPAAAAPAASAPTDPRSADGAEKKGKSGAGAQVKETGKAGGGQVEGGGRGGAGKTDKEAEGGGKGESGGEVLPNGVGGKEEDDAGEEAERERRRAEARAKAAEAENRKKKQLARAQARAEARAKAEAEAAQKRREKEREKRARKKAGAAGAAAGEPESAAAEAEAEEVPDEPEEEAGAAAESAEGKAAASGKVEGWKQGKRQQQRKRTAALPIKKASWKGVFGEWGQWPVIAAALVVLLCAILAFFLVRYMGQPTVVADK